MRVAIATAFSTDYLPGYVASEVNERYAARHGYSFFCEVLPVEVMLATIAPRNHCTWYKVHLFRRLLEADPPFSRVMWLDADAVVVKPEVSLEEIIAFGHDRDLIISEDLTACCKINCGVMILKNSEWTRRVWQEVWESDKWHCSPFYEQATLSRWLDRNEPRFRQAVLRPNTVRDKTRAVQVLDHVSVLPQIVLNCNRGAFATAHKRGSTKSKEAHKNDDEEPQFIFHAVGYTKLEAIIGALEYFQLQVPSAASRFHHIFPRRLRTAKELADKELLLCDTGVIKVLNEMQQMQSCFGLLDITNEGLTDAVCPALSTLLTASWCSLQSLYLGGNEFGVEGLTLLAQGVSSCDSLETLELNRCSINMAGLQALSLHLRSNSLQKLDLSDNPFSLSPKEVWLSCIDRLSPRKGADNGGDGGGRTKGSLVHQSRSLGLLDLLIEELSEPLTILAAFEQSFTSVPCSRVDRSPRTLQFSRRNIPNPCVILA